ncbi:PilZ domain-containing protein [Paenibacillus sp. KN14-4R]|uniref:PilZ domain-containing protein n=1 Tax=Paenibacillus sp. KN14-4R TaxID=3445773 RepID=UPI003FA159CA
MNSHMNEDRPSHTPPTFGKGLGAAQAFVNSITVIEKNNFVSTGILKYAEGDIIEVEIAEWEVFKLGESLKLTIYSTSGIHHFESRVIARDSGSVIVINPPDVKRKSFDQREHPRVDVNQSGMIRMIENPRIPIKSLLPTPVPLTVTNLSLGGIGFTVLAGEMDFDSSFLVGMEVDLGFKLSVQAEIVHRSSVSVGVYYGAKFVKQPSIEELTSLRSFIMRAQVGIYLDWKKAQA